MDWDAYNKLPSDIQAEIDQAMIEVNKLTGEPIPEDPDA